MKRFLIALQFLTILPLKIRSQIKEADYAGSLLYFPLAGLLIGLVSAGAAVSLGFLPLLVKGALILIITIVITGGIHLDGFADACDGFYAGKTPDEILLIMKDSRIGVMGAIGIFCILLLKFVIIVSIPQDMLWRSLILMAVFSRWSQALACAVCGYARKEGKAKFFVEGSRNIDIIAGGIFTFILFLLLTGISGVLIFIVSFVAVFSFIAYTGVKIRGVTGDTIGAASEIAEAAVLLVIAARGLS